MPILLGAVLVFVIYLLYQLFVNGYLFKIILFFGGWFGIFVWLNTIEGCNNTAIRLGSHGTSITWAALIPTIVCFLCLLSTKVE